MREKKKEECGQECGGGKRKKLRGKGEKWGKIVNPRSEARCVLVSTRGMGRQSSNPMEHKAKTKGEICIWKPLW